MAALGCAIGCGNGRGNGTPTQPEGGARLRVASLSPALSDTLIALDCGAQLAARTPWCPVDPEIPVVGTLLDIDAEQLTAIDPELILVQPPMQGAPEELAALARQQGWRVAEIRIDSLDDVGASFASVACAIDPGGNSGCTARAEALAASLRAACLPIDGAASLGRVALLGSVSDAGALAFGRGSFPGDAAVSMGVTLADAGAAYAQRSREELALLAPDLIVVIGGPEERARWMDAPAGELAPGSRLLVVEEPRLLQPGASLVQGLATLRKALEGARQ